MPILLNKGYLRVKRFSDPAQACNANCTGLGLRQKLYTPICISANFVLGGRKTP